MTILIIYAVLFVICFTVLGYFAGDMGIWQVFGLSLIAPLTAYFAVLQYMFKVIPWKV